MSVGNKPLKKKEAIATPDTLHCMCCNNELNIKEFYNSDSDFHRSVGKIPYCKECIDKFYQNYFKKYKSLGYDSPDRKAIERICMLFDVYYSNEIFDSVSKKIEEDNSGTLTGLYFRYAKLYQYRKKNYDTTMEEKYNSAKSNNSSVSIYTEDDLKKRDDIKDAVKIFGSGFDKEDYIYLYEQYQDWTARHECNTKAQEEVFKNICLTQLQLLKATKSGDISDAKDLSIQLQKWLDTGKLQPKQNSGETISDAQTFGTLIDKWENTRPLPEIDDDLKDVDNIGLYIDVFFRGHTAKTVGLTNAFSNLYDKFMKKFTVEKPHRSEDEDDEALFDAIFGSASDMKD